MAINDRTIQWNLQVAGAPQAVNDMADVSGAMTNLDDTSRLAATRFTGLASASSALGTVLSRTTPQVGGLASALGTAGGATSGLVTAIGGVAGLAAGGLVAALSLAVDWFVRSEDAAASAKNEYIAAANAALGAAKAISKMDKARAKASRAELDAKTRADLVETIDEAEAKILEKKKEAKELQGDINDFAEEENQIKFKGLMDEINALSVTSKRAQEELKIKREKEAALDAAEVETEWEIEKLKVLEKQSKTRKAMRDDWNSWIKSMAADGDVTELLEAFDPVDPVEQELEPRYQEYLDNREKMLAESLARIKKQEDDAAAAFTNTWQGSLSIVQSGFNDVAANMLAGNEVSLENILSMMGTQIIKDGIKNMWVAGGMLLNPITAGSGGALMGYAAAEIAAGTAMAQAGGAASGDTGGGPGGAGGTSGLAPARPTPVAEDILRQRQETPTTIHVHTLNPSVESGIAIDKSLTAARNKRGRYAMTYRN